MPQKTLTSIFESPEAKEKYLNEIIAFFQDERDEVIGLIAAEDILEFFLETLEPKIYKKAAEDCKKLLKEKVTDLELELDSLSST